MNSQGLGLIGGAVFHSQKLGSVGSRLFYTVFVHNNEFTFKTVFLG